MHEFDTYIKSIVNDLKISNKKKDEITEEFKDHLEMLKIGNVNKGFSESDAIKEAINSFGSNKVLQEKLSDSLNHYKSIPNIILGIFFFLIIFRLGSYISIPYLWPNNYLKMFIFGIIGTISLFLPIGYFLPVLFQNMRKVKCLTITCLIPGVLFGIYVGVDVYEVIPAKELFISIFTVGSILGGLLGFYLLKVFNLVTLACVNMTH